MKRAVVIGSGRSVWEDLRIIGLGAPVFAVNDMLIYAPRVDYGVSHHPDKLLHWNALRTMAGERQPRESGITLHSSRDHLGIDRVWPEYRSGGSSALLAVRIALALGFQPIWIAGVPLDDRGYVWSDPYERRSYDFSRYRRSWEHAKTELEGRVFSPSGYLCQLFGPQDVAQSIHETIG